MGAGIDVERMVADLRVAGAPDRPVRHQAIVLLWAIGRAKNGQPRLVHWSEARGELRNLLDRFGLPESRATPEYPFVALDRSDWWKLVGYGGAVPPAHGSEPLAWLNANDPRGGLLEDLHRQLAGDAAMRDRAVQALLDRFFPDEPADDLLTAVYLDTTTVLSTAGKPRRGPAWT